VCSRQLADGFFCERLEWGIFDSPTIFDMIRFLDTKALNPQIYVSNSGLQPESPGFIDVSNRRFL
jgi:hypothetical protein